MPLQHTEMWFKSQLQGCLSERNESRDVALIHCECNPHAILEEVNPGLVCKYKKYCACAHVKSSRVALFEGGSSVADTGTYIHT
jgi:hypothetical protein